MRLLLAVAWSAWMLVGTDALPATASGRGAGMPPALRSWTLSCDPAPPSAVSSPGACRLTARLRGEIDASRLRLVQEAMRRRDDARRRLARDVRLHVDVDSQGGNVFAAMEIGRILRAEAASISVARGASCVSACVFVLMGAPLRSVADGARIGIHRPSLGDSRSETIVDALSAAIVSYVDQMRVSRAIVADMMRIPSARMRFLTTAELDGYGIRRVSSGPPWERSKGAISVDRSTRVRPARMNR